MLSAQVKGFGTFEAQEWQVDWEDAIEPYIVNAVSNSTGQPLPDGAAFTGKLKIDRNSFGGYRITDVTVRSYDISQEFTNFCNAKNAGQKVGGKITPTEYKNFVKIDESEFKKHGVIDLHFDTQNFDPSILTGAPCTYFKLAFAYQAPKTSLNSMRRCLRSTASTNLDKKTSRWPRA